MRLLRHVGVSDTNGLNLARQVSDTWSAVKESGAENGKPVEPVYFRRSFAFLPRELGFFPVKTTAAYACVP